MAKAKSVPAGLPMSTPVELVGRKGDKSTKIELTLEDALKKKAELESEFEPKPTDGSRRLKKWRGWYFQIYQLGFSSHKSNDRQKGNAQE